LAPALAAAAAKARKSWQLATASGKTRVRYMENKLMNYSTTWNRFVPIYTTSQIMAMADGDEMVPCSQIGDITSFIYTLDVPQDVKDKLQDCALDKSAKDAYTGNHYRKHYTTIKSSRTSAHGAF